MPTNECETDEMLTRLSVPMLPEVEGLTITLAGAPSKNGAAVLLDVIKLDDDEIALLATSANGRSVPSAYATATAKLSFRHVLKTGSSPANVLKMVNNELFQLVGNDVFFKAFVGIIDLRTNIFKYSNAGMSDVGIVRNCNKVELAAIGGHLALFPEWAFEEKSFALEPGDIIEIPPAEASEKKGINHQRLLCKVNGAARKVLYLATCGFDNSATIHMKTIHDFDQMKLLIRDLINEADQIGYPMKFQKNFRLVLIELLTNAIIHGNKYDFTKKTVILFEVNPQFIELGVIDEGEGYNPATIPDPLAPENINKPHGRGLFLIKHYAESFAVRGKGNITTVRFARSKAQ